MTHDPIEQIAKTCNHILLRSQKLFNLRYRNWLPCAFKALLFDPITLLSGTLGPYWEYWEYNDCHRAINPNAAFSCTTNHENRKMAPDPFFYFQGKGIKGTEEQKSPLSPQTFLNTLIPSIPDFFHTISGHNISKKRLEKDTLKPMAKRAFHQEINPMSLESSKMENLESGFFKHHGHNTVPLFKDWDKEDHKNKDKDEYKYEYKDKDKNEAAQSMDWAKTDTLNKNLLNEYKKGIQGDLSEALYAAWTIQKGHAHESIVKENPVCKRIIEEGPVYEKGIKEGAFCEKRGNHIYIHNSPIDIPQSPLVLKGTKMLESMSRIQDVIRANIKTGGPSEPISLSPGRTGAERHVDDTAATAKPEPMSLSPGCTGARPSHVIKNVMEPAKNINEEKGIDMADMHADIEALADKLADLMEFELIRTYGTSGV